MNVPKNKMHPAGGLHNNFFMTCVCVQNFPSCHISTVLQKGGLIYRQYIVFKNVVLYIYKKNTYIYKSNLFWDKGLGLKNKLDGVGLVDNRPSTN